MGQSRRDGHPRDAAGPARSVHLPALALAFAAASVVVTLDTEVQTTYAAMPGRAALDLAAGVGLIAAGVLTWAQRPVGPLAVALGVAWLAQDWVGWVEGPAFARSVAMVAAPFLLPLLAHLVVGSATRAVAFTYAVTALVSAGLAFARDPFLDPNCWSNCTDNVFLVHASPGAVRLIEGFWLPFSVVASLLVTTFAVWRLWSASRPGRAAIWTILVPAGLAALGGAAHAMLLLADPAEDPRRDVFDAVFVARALAFVALAVGVAWTVVRARRTRAAIARLAADLGETPEPGSLRAVLARTLGISGSRSPTRCPARSATSMPRAGRSRSTRGPRPRSSATASRSRSSSMTRRSPARGSSSARSARPRGSRSTTSGCGPASSPSSRTCAPRAHGSSRRATRRAGASSATSTTVRSSAC